MWATFLSKYGGDGTWANASHFNFLSKRVLEMHRGELQRLCVSMPPGSGKSEYLSLAVASWWLGSRPNSRVVIASYGKSLSVGWSERARDAMATLGPEVFGVGANSREKAEFWKPRDPETGKAMGGYFFAVGRGGPLTGKRAELLIVDDLIKDDMEAGSPAVREHAWRWFDKVAMTRLLPHSVVCCIATRWHADDPIGRLEDKQRAGEVELPWTFVNLPALAGENDPLGRKPGEALWPQMWPTARLEKVRQGRDPYTWAALYQGTPTPEGGSVFKPAWVRSFEQVGPVYIAQGELHNRPNRPEMERLRCLIDDLMRFSTVDLAGSKKERADWTVIATWGIDHKTRTLWLLDVRRKRLEAPQIIEEMRAVQRDLNPITFYVEEAGPSLNLVHQLRFAEQAGRSHDPTDTSPNVLMQTALEAGVPVQGIKPVRDKLTRAMPATAVMSNGRLLTPARATWLETFKDELFRFPDSKHDDQVDAVSIAAQVFLEVLAASDHRRGEDDDPNPIAGRLNV